VCTGPESLRSPVRECKRYDGRERVRVPCLGWRESGRTVMKDCMTIVSAVLAMWLFVPNGWTDGGDVQRQEGHVQED
jgi:hypothetical protein